jgi:hypothetical protein
MPSDIQKNNNPSNCNRSLFIYFFQFDFGCTTYKEKSQKIPLSKKMWSSRRKCVYLSRVSPYWCQVGHRIGKGGGTDAAVSKPSWTKECQ